MLQVVCKMDIDSERDKYRERMVMLRVVCKMDVDSERDAYRKRMVILKSSTLRDMMMNNDIKLHHTVQGPQGRGEVARKNQQDDWKGLLVCIFKCVMMLTCVR